MIVDHPKAVTLGASVAVADGAALAIDLASASGTITEVVSKLIRAEPVLYSCHSENSKTVIVL